MVPVFIVCARRSAGLLVTCGVAAALVVGCRTSGSPAVIASPPSRAVAPVSPARESENAPKTAEDCRRCNGIWAAHGIATTPSCNCRTRDGGQRCRDGAECEGACVAADEPERETVMPGPPARGYFVGRCSDLMTVFGCNRFIDRGALARGPVALDDPPIQMCVD